jgi:hypothetical protein
MDAELLIKSFGPKGKKKRMGLSRHHPCLVRNAYTQHPLIPASLGETFLCQHETRHLQDRYKQNRKPQKTAVSDGDVPIGVQFGHEKQLLFEQFPRSIQVQCKREIVTPRGLALQASAAKMKLSL